MKLGKFAFKEPGKILEAMAGSETETGIAAFAKKAGVTRETLVNAIKGKSLLLRSYLKICRACGIEPRIDEGDLK